MAACWRELCKHTDIDFNVLAWSTENFGDAPFDTSLVANIPCQLLSPRERESGARIAELVTAQRPDIVVLPGWAYPQYRRLVRNPRLAHCRFAMFMDTPWRGTWRQRLARFKVGKYIDRMDRVILPGERSWQFARRLGVPERKIVRGLYGIDYASLRDCYVQRQGQPGGWPRSFLFSGRYNFVKGIDCLLRAYSIYRERTADPWPLRCCGAGPLAELLTSMPGVEDLGFVQPKDQPAVFARHGVFVLPSRFDPWPLVIAEAAASGLPVVCTEACGSSVELVRGHFNGLTVPSDDTQALARGLGWMHANYDRLPELGLRGQSLAGAYSAEIWAQRWAACFRELVRANAADS